MDRFAKIIPDKAMLWPSVAVFAVTFVLQFIDLTYQAFQIDPPPSHSLLVPIAYLWAVSLWFEADSSREGNRLPLDTGLLLSVAWLVLLPIYLIVTRGWAGLIGVAGFVASAIAAWIVATIILFLLF